MPSQAEVRDAFGASRISRGVVLSVQALAEAHSLGAGALEKVASKVEGLTAHAGRVTVQEEDFAAAEPYVAKMIERWIGEGHATPAPEEPEAPEDDEDEPIQRVQPPALIGA